MSAVVRKKKQLMDVCIEVVSGLWDIELALCEIELKMIKVHLGWREKHERL